MGKATPVGMLQHRGHLHAAAGRAALLLNHPQGLDRAALVISAAVAVAPGRLLSGEIGLHQPLGLPALPRRLHRGGDRSGQHL